MKKKMQINAVEANLLLFAIDHWLRADNSGKLQAATAVPQGYSIQDAQRLRDRLFIVHEHPDEG